MAHGHPDYGGAAPLATVYTLQDMAELAARLGSIVTFDRRGNVIFLENFEGGLAKWVTNLSAGGSIAISSERARHGSFSCKLTTDGDNFDYCQIQCPIEYPIESKLGLEVCWNRSDSGNLGFIEIYFDLYDGTNMWYSLVRWEKATGIWTYRDEDGNFTPLSPTVDYLEDELPFHHTKLVVDFVNKEYVRLIADNTIYDMAGLGLKYLVTNAAPMLQPRVKTYSNGGGAAVNYIDSMIITQNEP